MKEGGDGVIYFGYRRPSFLQPIVPYLKITMPIEIKDGKISGTLITPSWEAAPLAAVVTPDLNGDGNHLGFDAPFEFAGGGLFVYALYSGVLTALQLEPFVRNKQLTRQDQVSAVWAACGDAVKNNWLKVVAVSVVCSLIPALVPFIAVSSVFTGVFMADKVVRSFWIALTPEQRANIQEAAEKAGVPMPDATTDGGKPAGYDEIDPLPVGA